MQLQRVGEQVPLGFDKKAELKAEAEHFLLQFELLHPHSGGSKFYEVNISGSKIFSFRYKRCIAVEGQMFDHLID